MIVDNSCDATDDNNDNRDVNPCTNADRNIDCEHETVQCLNHPNIDIIFPLSLSRKQVRVRDNNMMTLIILSLNIRVPHVKIIISVCFVGWCVLLSITIVKGGDLVGCIV